MDRFDEIALKIVPLGSRPLLRDLREEIAATIRDVIQDAIEKYRNSQISDDLRRIEYEAKQRHAELSKRIGAFENERKEFRKVVAGHVRLLNAVEAWIEWCSGNGNSDEQTNLWTEIRLAYEEYRSLRSA